MSTDTAFSLALLGLLAPAGTRVRVFLLTLAIVDDFVALLVIAVVYTESLSVAPLLVAIGLFVVLLAIRYAPLAWRRQAAVVFGVGLWAALHESGIDPVIAGLAVGLVASAYPPNRGELERVTELARAFREQPTPELARLAQLGVASAISLNERLQHRFHPLSSYVVVPLFALANAGIRIDGDLLRDAAGSAISLGIVLGYVVGKPLGVLAASWLATRLRPGVPRPLSWPVLGGAGTVAGIGFTVSLLISTRAFEGRELDEAKVGLLASVLLAAALSFFVIRLIRLIPAERRAQQIAATSPELLDLAEEVDPSRDHVRGPDGAAVTLVEYGDYQCRYCGEAEVVIRELLEDFGDDLRYVWRHLPLNDVHPNAQLAAEAALAAEAQGAFWQMHDVLLDNPEHLSGPDLGSYAEQLGLDVERFFEELRRRDYAERVAEDVASADLSGVSGTPTFFINGRRHQGAYDVETLSAAVRSARTRAQLGMVVAGR
jgi:Na+/H+ antiporter NhaA